MPARRPADKPLGMRIGESAFCIAYLVFVTYATCVFLRAGLGGSRVEPFAIACGAMTLLLGMGDAFHLVPRIVANVRGPARSAALRRRQAFWLGLGNLVSSITMTLFYLLLFFVMWLATQPTSGLAMPFLRKLVFAVLAGLALLRVALCLSPQNEWFEERADSRWGLYRNVPFALIGAITVAYLVVWYDAWVLALLVAASFACYLAVVLLAKRSPMAGMLMIPKTLCYVALIAVLMSWL